MDVVGVLVALVTGLVAGTVAGVFGVGGGVVMVPVLHYLVGLPFVLSTQVSLLVIAVNTPFGLWRQHRRENVLWRHGFLLAAGGVAGVFLAILLRPLVSEVFLKVLFALVAMWAAYRMLRPLQVRARALSPGWLLPAGVAAGAAAHWLGIGGGLLMVPALVLLGTTIHRAVATSLVAVFTNAAVSTLWDLPVLVHQLGVAVPLGVGAVVGIQAGVWLANATHPGRLRAAFALFLFLMAAYILADALVRDAAAFWETL